MPPNLVGVVVIWGLIATTNPVIVVSRVYVLIENVLYTPGGVGLLAGASAGGGMKS